MSRQRGFLSIYFKDKEVLDDLEKVMRERLPNRSTSSVICNIVGQVLKQIKQTPKDQKTLKARVDIILG